jgi:hypothetical protein
MRAGIVLAWAVALLGANCFSPKYHNGNLHCTDAGQCPENYHCAVDNTCWQNGSDPVIGDDAAVPPAADAPAAVSATDAAADAPVQADSAGATGVEAAGVGVPLSQLAAEYARVICAKNFACCAQSDLRGKTLVGCEQNVANVFQSAVQAITDGIGRSRTIYYPERAEQCLQRIEATACEAWPLDPVTQLPAVCDNAIESLVPTGGPCRSVAECASRLCTGASSNADGTCLPKAAGGETCVQILAQNSCEAELYCDSSNRCVATKVDGTSCAGNRECKSLTCGSAPDAGNICLPAVCYSNGPLLPPACSLGGRPSAFGGGLALLAVLACVLRRRRFR